MKWLHYKQIALKSLRVDAADIRKRTKAAHVTELAQNIRDSGNELIHALTVRADDKRLLCGRDRLAALVVLKVKAAWVHLVECNDQEAKELEVWENVYRRPIANRAEMLAGLVAAKEAEIQASRDAEPRTVSPAPQRSAKAEARKQVARAAGITTAAVKKAEQRAAAKESAAGDHGPLPSEPAASAVEPAPALDLLGCDDASAEAVAKFARKDQEAIDEADKHMRLAQAAISRMTPSTMAQELKADVHRVAGRVRAARPEFICPWCKGLPKAEVPPCAPCGGLGYVSKEVKGRAPKELYAADVAPLVSIDGKFRLYTDVRDGKWEPPKNGAPAKKEKRISVELPGGRVVDPEREADDAEQAY